jgi:hypothetical protein
MALNTSPRRIGAGTVKGSDAGPIKVQLLYEMQSRRRGRRVTQQVIRKWHVNLAVKVIAIIQAPWESPGGHFVLVQEATTKPILLKVRMSMLWDA